MFTSIKQYFLKKKLKDSKYSYFFDTYKGEEYVCFDCETTGLNPKKDHIISIGAVIIKNNTIISSKKFERFVKPKSKLHEESIKIHHLREVDLLNAEDIDDVIVEFLEFIGNRNLVGYYLEFDVAMINKYVKPKIGIPLQNKQIEISALYYDKLVKNPQQTNIDLRFKTIMEKLELPVLGAHDAINDAIMTAMIFIKLQNIKKIH
ncbi:MAG TPA: 3'-5' exonuclease [Arcobacter sp.]|jgi:DNA polymerase-3 subunit epsilon|nr:3'-5' exonuclease [Arcobacter sp.]